MNIGDQTVQTNSPAQLEKKHSLSHRPTEQKSRCEKYGWFIFYILMEGLIIFLFQLFTSPSIEVNPITADVQNAISQEHVKQYYPAYQDIHVMMLIGFGCLYMYLHRYSWTSMSQNFLILVYTIQISILLNGFFEMVVAGHFEATIKIDIRSLIKSDFAAAAVLISLGGILGKFNFGQCLVLATLEIIFYAPNVALGEGYFFAIDAGGSMYIHTFGCYFGLSLSIAYSWYNEDNVKDHPHNRGGYGSNLFGYIGTAFLWLFWPSFNGALASGNAQHRAIVNTVFSLTGSALAVFFITPLINKGKFKMENLLNATLAGGVAVGASCDVLGKPWTSILIGFIAGTISVLGFEYLSPILQKKMRLYDTAGIHNLHGLPGVFGSIVGIILAAQASADELGPSLVSIFPGIAAGRTPFQQAQFQASALASSILFAVVGGMITGLILRTECCFYGPIEQENLFTDLIYFEELEDSETLIENMPIDDTMQKDQQHETFEMKKINNDNPDTERDLIHINENLGHSRHNSKPKPLVNKHGRVESASVLTNKLTGFFNTFDIRSPHINHNQIYSIRESPEHEEITPAKDIFSK